MARQWRYLTQEQFIEFQSINQLSYAELADYFGFSNKSIANWLSGAFIPLEAVQTVLVQKIFQDDGTFRTVASARKSKNARLDELVATTATHCRGGKSRRKVSWSVVSLRDINDFRELHNLNFAQLAKYLGFSAAGVHHWFDGISIPWETTQKAILEKITEPNPQFPEKPQRSKLKAQSDILPGKKPNLFSLLQTYLLSPGGQNLTAQQLLDLAVKLQETFN